MLPICYPLSIFSPSFSVACFHHHMVSQCHFKFKTSKTRLFHQTQHLPLPLLSLNIYFITGVNESSLSLNIAFRFRMNLTCALSVLPSCVPLNQLYPFILQTFSWACLYYLHLQHVILNPFCTNTFFSYRKCKTLYSRNKPKFHLLIREGKEFCGCLVYFKPVQPLSELHHLPQLISQYQSPVRL